MREPNVTLRAVTLSHENYTAHTDIFLRVKILTTLCILTYRGRRHLIE